MNYSINDDDGKTLHGIEKNVGADPRVCPFLSAMRRFQKHKKTRKTRKNIIVFFCPFWFSFVFVKTRQRTCSGRHGGLPLHAMPLHNLPSKRGQGDVGELEVLLAEGDANDGDIEQATEEHVREPNPNTADEEPQDIHSGVQTAAGGLLLHLRAKGPQSQESELQRLQAEGNTDDGDHHGKTCHEIFNGDFNAAKHKPNDIA